MRCRVGDSGGEVGQKLKGGHSFTLWRATPRWMRSGVMPVKYAWLMSEDPRTTADQREYDHEFF